tara:strand:- start:103 stop:516 length:414 start_codon:yes stop_codon:yes gene_type:complete
MLKIYITIFIFLFSLPIKAEWQFISQNTYGSKTFVDFDKIKRGFVRKDYVYYLNLVNYSQSSPYREMLDKIGMNSSVQELNVDCKSMSLRMLSMNYYSEFYAKGRKTKVPKVSKVWLKPPLDSYGYNSMTKICNFDK